MSRVDKEMLHLEEEMRGIQESGSLFEVNVPEFKLLKQCRKELRMLKVTFFNYKYVFYYKDLNIAKGFKGLFNLATLGLCLHSKVKHRRLEKDSLA